ncbi:hypothetical protein ADUPG1_007329, partial [Aduncisulcus paluster]
MIESIITSFVSRIFGKYCYGISPKDFKVSLLSGKIKLDNLELKPNAFKAIAPFLSITYSHIGEIHIEVPWASLKKKSVKVEIKDIFVVVTPIASASFSKKMVRKMIRNRNLDKEKDISDRQEPNAFKAIAPFLSITYSHIGEIHIEVPWASLKKKSVKVEIKDIFVVVTPIASASFSKKMVRKMIRNRNLDKEKDISDRQEVNILGGPNAVAMLKKKGSIESFLTSSSQNDSLLDVIINNVELSIKNIHIRVEDSSAPIPFAVGVGISNILAHTTDHNWNKTFLSGMEEKTEKSIFRIAEIQGLYIYVDERTFFNTSEYVRKSRLFIQEIMRTHSPDHQTILGPLSITGHLTVAPAPTHADIETKSFIPRVSLDLDFPSSLDFQVSDTQLHVILNSIFFWDAYGERPLDLLLIRPTNRPKYKRTARQWWMYAVVSIAWETKGKKSALYHLLKEKTTRRLNYEQGILLSKEKAMVEKEIEQVKTEIDRRKKNPLLNAGQMQSTLDSSLHGPSTSSTSSTSSVTSDVDQQQESSIQVLDDEEIDDLSPEAHEAIPDVSSLSPGDLHSLLTSLSSRHSSLMYTLNRVIKEADKHRKLGGVGDYMCGVRTRYKNCYKQWLTTRNKKLREGFRDSMQELMEDLSMETIILIQEEEDRKLIKKKGEDWVYNSKFGKKKWKTLKKKRKVIAQLREQVFKFTKDTSEEKIKFEVEREKQLALLEEEETRDQGKESKFEDDLLGEEKSDESMSELSENDTKPSEKPELKDTVIGQIEVDKSVLSFDSSRLMSFASGIKDRIMKELDKQDSTNTIFNNVDREISEAKKNKEKEKSEQLSDISFCLPPFYEDFRLTIDVPAITMRLCVAKKATEMIIGMEEEKEVDIISRVPLLKLNILHVEFLLSQRKEGMKVRVLAKELNIQNLMADESNLQPLEGKIDTKPKKKKKNVKQEHQPEPCLYSHILSHAVSSHPVFFFVYESTPPWGNYESVFKVHVSPLKLCADPYMLSELSKQFGAGDYTNTIISGILSSDGGDSSGDSNEFDVNALVSKIMGLYKDVFSMFESKMADSAPSMEDFEPAMLVETDKEGSAQTEAIEDTSLSMSLLDEADLKVPSNSSIERDFYDVRIHPIYLIIPIKTNEKELNEDELGEIMAEKEESPCSSSLHCLFFSSGEIRILTTEGKQFAQHLGAKYPTPLSLLNHLRSSGSGYFIPPSPTLLSSLQKIEGSESNDLDELSFFSIEEEVQRAQKEGEEKALVKKQREKEKVKKKELNLKNIKEMTLTFFSRWKQSLKDRELEEHRLKRKEIRGVDEKAEKQKKIEEEQKKKAAKKKRRGKEESSEDDEVCDMSRLMTSAPIEEVLANSAIHHTVQPLGKLLPFYDIYGIFESNMFLGVIVEQDIIERLLKDPQYVPSYCKILKSVNKSNTLLLHPLSLSFSIAREFVSAKHSTSLFSYIHASPISLSLHVDLLNSLLNAAASLLNILITAIPLFEVYLTRFADAIIQGRVKAKIGIEEFLENESTEQLSGERETSDERSEQPYSDTPRGASKHLKKHRFFSSLDSIENVTPLSHAPGRDEKGRIDFLQIIKTIIARNRSKRLPATSLAPSSTASCPVASFTSFIDTIRLIISDNSGEIVSLSLHHLSSNIHAKNLSVYGHIDVGKLMVLCGGRVIVESKGLGLCNMHIEILSPNNPLLWERLASGINEKVDSAKQLQEGESSIDENSLESNETSRSEDKRQKKMKEDAEIQERIFAMAPASLSVSQPGLALYLDTLVLNSTVQRLQLLYGILCESEIMIKLGLGTITDENEEDLRQRLVTKGNERMERAIEHSRQLSKNISGQQNEFIKSTSLEGVSPASPVESSESPDISIQESSSKSPIEVEIIDESESSSSSQIVSSSGLEDVEENLTEGEILVKKISLIFKKMIELTKTLSEVERVALPTPLLRLSLSLSSLRIDLFSPISVVRRNIEQGASSKPHSNVICKGVNINIVVHTTCVDGDFETLSEVERVALPTPLLRLSLSLSSLRIDLFSPISVVRRNIEQGASSKPHSNVICKGVNINIVVHTTCVDGDFEVGEIEVTDRKKKKGGNYVLKVDRDILANMDISENPVSDHLTASSKLDSSSLNEKSGVFHEVSQEDSAQQMSEFIDDYGHTRHIYPVLSSNFLLVSNQSTAYRGYNAEMSFVLHRGIQLTVTAAFFDLLLASIDDFFLEYFPSSSEEWMKIIYSQQNIIDNQNLDADMQRDYAFSAGGFPRNADSEGTNVCLARVLQSSLTTLKVDGKINFPRIFVPAFSSTTSHIGDKIEEGIILSSLQPFCLSSEYVCEDDNPMFRITTTIPHLEASCSALGKIFPDTPPVLQFSHNTRLYAAFPFLSPFTGIDMQIPELKINLTPHSFDEIMKVVLNNLIKMSPEAEYMYEMRNKEKTELLQRYELEQQHRSSSDNGEHAAILCVNSYLDSILHGHSDFSFFQYADKERMLFKGSLRFGNIDIDLMGNRYTYVPIPFLSIKSDGLAIEIETKRRGNIMVNCQLKDLRMVDARPGSNVSPEHKEFVRIIPHSQYSLPRTLITLGNGKKSEKENHFSTWNDPLLEENKNLFKHDSSYFSFFPNLLIPSQHKEFLTKPQRDAITIRILMNSFVDQEIDISVN